jgi:hypothetical protein
LRLDVAAQEINKLRDILDKITIMTDYITPAGIR